MKTTKHLVLLSALFVFLTTATADKIEAQDLEVTNINYTIQENDVAIIHFDLEDGGRNRKYNVNLTLNQLSDPTLNYRPQAVVGDIGKGRFEGANNKIVWSMMHEDPDDFVMNPFIDNYYFTIEARRRSRAGWWLFFTVVGGAATYYFSSY